MPKNADHSFNVNLYPDQTQKLKDLAAKSNVSMAHVVRGLITAAYAHAFLGHPQCADASRCFVPQMHDPAPALAPKTPAAK